MFADVCLSQEHKMQTEQESSCKWSVLLVTDVTSDATNKLGIANLESVAS